MMFQSDFHRKKNFANPNLFNVRPQSPFHLKISIFFNLIVFIFLYAQNSTQKESAPAASQPTPAAGRQEGKEETITKPDQEVVHPEHLLKHPLQNTWTLWYLENDRNKTWEEMQNEITSFDTVEDFWR